MGHNMFGDDLIEHGDGRFGGLAAGRVGADRVAGVVIDQLQDHACATTGQNVLVAIQLPARIRGRIHKPAPR